MTTYATTATYVPATKKKTTSVTATRVKSVVQTQVIDVTATQINSETVTVTQDVSVTQTTGTVGGPPFRRDAGVDVDNPFLAVAVKDWKRAVLVAPTTTCSRITKRPTKVDPTATACNSAGYSSACSCIGVTAWTSTAPRPTTTKTVIQTITRAKPVTTTVKTVVYTTTAKTNTVTTTFSTKSITTTVTTVEIDTTVATQTVVETQTVNVPPNPVQTAYLRIVGSQDPTLAEAPENLGFSQLESFRGSDFVFYYDFNNNFASTLLTGINAETGEVTVINGGGQSPGEALYYSTFGGLSPASYVNVSTRDFATNQGGQPVVCKIVSGPGFEFLQCKWGDNQIADMWTCAQRLNFVRPGYDFSHACRDASTSYKIGYVRVDRV